MLESVYDSKMALSAGILTTDLLDNNYMGELKMTLIQLLGQMVKMKPKFVYFNNSNERFPLIQAGNLTTSDGQSSITVDRMKTLDLSYPLFFAESGYIMKIPKANTCFALLGPLGFDVWALLAFSSAVTFLLSAWIVLKFTQFPIMTTLTTAFEFLINDERWVVREMREIWSLIVLRQSLMTVGYVCFLGLYSARLVSFLSATCIIPNINSYEDILREMNEGRMKNVRMETYDYLTTIGTFNGQNLSVLEAIQKKNPPIIKKSVNDVIKTLLASTSSPLLFSSNNKLLSRSFFRNPQLTCKLQYLGDRKVVLSWSGFALRKKSNLTEYFSRAVQRLQETGLVGYWIKRLSTDIDKNPCRPPDANTTPLDLEKLQGVFMSFSAAMIVSTVALFVEIFYKTKRRVHYSFVRIRHPIDVTSVKMAR